MADEAIALTPITVNFPPTRNKKGGLEIMVRNAVVIVWCVATLKDEYNGRIHTTENLGVAWIGGATKANQYLLSWRVGISGEPYKLIPVARRTCVLWIV